jgi:hypothetical protein
VSGEEINRDWESPKGANNERRDRQAALADTNLKAKGPASVAPDPDRGSTNPAEDRMNAHSNTTLAPAASKDFI